MFLNTPMRRLTNIFGLSAPHFFHGDATLLPPEPFSFKVQYATSLICCTFVTDSSSLSHDFQLRRGCRVQKPSLVILDKSPLKTLAFKTNISTYMKFDVLPKIPNSQGRPPDIDM